MREQKYKVYEGGEHGRGMSKKTYTIQEIYAFCPSTDAESISEYKFIEDTGLKDRNGVEVFEGDVVSYTNMKLGHQVAVVEWNPFGSMAGFQCKNPFVNIFDSEEILVVGNIHENPELLEQSK